jgi:hypothetical protein
MCVCVFVCVCVYLVRVCMCVFLQSIYSVCVCICVCKLCQLDPWTKSNTSPGAAMSVAEAAEASADGDTLETVWACRLVP